MTTTTERPMAAIEATVYDAFPSIAAMHDVDRAGYPDIVEDEFWRVFESQKRYTCLGVERFYNIFKSVEYIAKSGIPGNFAECGVFLGGSIIGAALFAEHFGITDRKFHVFDTFEGFPVNTIETDMSGTTYDLATLKLFNSKFRAVVEKNIAASGLPVERFVLHEGLVEDTLPGWTGDLAYLRLDTDYYTSTMVEMEQLYPKLASGGVLIIDDYGHFGGVRQAVDEYLDRQARRPLLQRIDYTGRCGIKV